MHKPNALGYNLFMPTVLRVNGFNVVINTHDHMPRHVHVLRAGGVVIIEIETGNIVRVRNMKAADVREAREIVEDNAAHLVAEWDRIKPIP